MLLPLTLSNALLVLSYYPSLIFAACYNPSPAFPVPTWTDKHQRSHFLSGLDRLSSKLDAIVSNPKYSTASLSISLTSQSETLWSYFHTARVLNTSRPGADPVDENTLFRIASITKTFTVLALLQQAKAGKVNLDDPVSFYLSDLPGPLPWKDITLRALASQLSGIPREFAQSDVLNALPDPTAYGLPPVDEKALKLPHCDEYENYDPPCTSSDLYHALSHAQPLYAPNQKSTYSNVNYELLGLVLENITGQPYEFYIQSHIFDDLDMSASTFSTPASDKHATLPYGESYYWEVDAGVQNPTGGIFSSGADMTKFARHVLTTYNALATGVNWLMPSSWSGGTQTFYGMPWEIFRSDRVLEPAGGWRRPVTFVTKSGGLPGYYSQLVLLPEYGLGVVVLVGSSVEMLGEVLEELLPSVVRIAEKAVWKDVEKGYEKAFAADKTQKLNSSVVMAVEEGRGLVVKEWISNSTVIVGANGVAGPALQLFSAMEKTDIDDPAGWYAQLVPTLLYKDEENQKGEIWRAITVPVRKAEDEKKVLSEFCITDEDPASYAGLPLNEFVFWHDDGELELPAWRVKLKAVQSKVEERLVVQS